MAAAKKKSKSKSRKRKSSRSRKSSNSVLKLIVVVVVIGFGAYYYLTGSDVLGIFTPVGEPPAANSMAGSLAASSAAPPPVTNVSGDWWEVYFADRHNSGDPDNWQGSIEGQIIKKIEAAQTSIHIASFEFNLTPVAEALVAAKQRGVDVRWVTDDEHGLEADEEPDHGQFEMLRDVGVEVQDDGRSALMHNKFWIFDGKTVWTGSTNITVNGIFKQDNNVIVIHSPEVAGFYEREFEEMWNGEHGPRSPSTVDEQSVVVNGAQVQALFAPEDDVVDHLLPFIEAAQTSIRFLAFSYTHDDLGDAMLARASAGVDVSGVFEKVGSETQYSEMPKLYCANVPVRQDGNPTFLHHKYIVVDDQIVITGSLNFSANADDSNDENVIVVDDAEIAALYIQEFERVWAEGEDPDPADMDCN